MSVFANDVLRNLAINPSCNFSTQYFMLTKKQYVDFKSPDSKYFPWNQNGVWSEYDVEVKTGPEKKRKTKDKLKWTSLACGSEVQRFGEKGLNNRVVLDYNAYYIQNKVKPPKLDAAVFPWDFRRLEKGVESIKRHVKADKLVRVPFMDKEKPNGSSTYIVPDHYVGIFAFTEGTDTDEFGYIDPYPGFSKLLYAGQLNYFMGKLVYNKKCKKGDVKGVFEMHADSVGGEVTLPYLPRVIGGPL